MNAQGRFDNERLVVSQMREIVRELYEHGCRIFNISLGDRRRVYRGAKVGTWTAVLDELARELDVLFVVSAGNYDMPRNARRKSISQTTHVIFWSH